jgi:hypothetical protein
MFRWQDRCLSSCKMQLTQWPNFFFLMFVWLCILVQQKSITNLMHNSFIFKKLYYIPLRVWGTTMLILRRSNCINTASGIVTLYKWLLSAQVNLCTLWLLSAQRSHIGIWRITVRSVITIHCQAAGAATHDVVWCIDVSAFVQLIHETSVGEIL